MTVPAEKCQHQTHEESWSHCRKLELQGRTDDEQH
jgi:hypothetical protein